MNEEQCKDRIEEINVLMRPIIEELQRLRDVKRPITVELRKRSRQREEDTKLGHRLQKEADAVEIIRLVVGGMTIIAAKESLGIHKRTAMHLRTVWLKKEYGTESIHSFGHPAWEARHYMRDHGIEAALQHFKPTLQYL